MKWDLFGRGSSAVKAVLEHVAGCQSQVLIEVEGSPRRFKSIIVVRKDSVLLPREEQGSQRLNKGAILRFRVPDTEDQAIRLKVIKPHFNLVGGKTYTLCKAEQSLLEGPQRIAPRFSTYRISDLILRLPDLKRQYKVTELSAGGMVVAVSDGEKSTWLPFGKTVTPAELSIRDFKIPFVGVVSRSNRPEGVGLEFIEVEDVWAKARLEKLLRTLEQKHNRKKIPKQTPASA